MRSVDLKGIHERMRRAGTELGPYRNICWFFGGVLMIWSYVRDWFFPAVAFAVVGGQLLWAATALVLAFRRPNTNETGAPKAPDMPTPTTLRSDVADSVPQTEQEERQTLIGAWFVTNDQKYLSRWTFRPDGSVESMFAAWSPKQQMTVHSRGNGNWRFDGNTVHITMNGIDPNTNKPYWFRFSRPIKATGVRFESSQNIGGQYYAVKLYSDQWPPI